MASSDPILEIKIKIRRSHALKFLQGLNSMWARAFIRAHVDAAAIESVVDQVRDQVKS